MISLMLFRHALATKSLSGYGDQILTASILPESIAPIQKMADFLKEISTDANFVSPVQRCQQTAKIITDINGKVFQTDDRLMEYQSKVPNETIQNLQKRCQDFLSEVEKKSLQNILVCTHGGVIAVLRSFFLNVEFSATDLTKYPATGELWIIRRDKIEAFDFN